MAHAAVGSDILEALDIEHDLSPKLTLDAILLLNCILQSIYFFGGERFRLLSGINVKRLENLAAPTSPDAVDGPEGKLDMLVRERDARDTNHSCVLALPLFVLGVLADDEETPLAAHQLALRAHLLDGRTDLHGCVENAYNRWMIRQRFWA